MNVNRVTTFAPALLDNSMITIKQKVYSCCPPLVAARMNFEPPLCRKLILCIDDDMRGLLLRKALLETQGYDVLIASSGPAGIIIVTQKLVDLIVVDYAMPQMDGAAVVLEIRKIRARVPIVMLSGHDMSEVPEHVRCLISRFVSKASPPTEFLSVLQELITNGAQAA